MTTANAPKPASRGIKWECPERLWCELGTGYGKPFSSRCFILAFCWWCGRSVQPTRLTRSSQSECVYLRKCDTFGCGYGGFFYLATRRKVNMVRAHTLGVYIAVADGSGFLTTLAFWLRSSVVSVLNSLTTIMKAPPSLLVI